MAAGLFQRLTRALWSKPAATCTASSQLFIDDDVVGGLEVLPASTADWCMAQFAAVADFARRHEAPSGRGWTDVYVRPAAPMTVANLAIPYAAAVDAISRLLPEFEEVITGSFENPQPVRGRGFGPSPLSAIVIYCNDEARVPHIDVTLRSSRAEAGQVLEAFAKMPSPAPLMLVDWTGAQYARTDRADEISAYLARHPEG